jgi:hypothetical protein
MDSSFHPNIATRQVGARTNLLLCSWRSCANEKQKSLSLAIYCKTTDLRQHSIGKIGSIPCQCTRHSISRALRGTLQIPPLLSDAARRKCMRVIPRSNKDGFVTRTANQRIWVHGLCRDMPRDILCIQRQPTTLLKMCST